MFVWGFSFFLPTRIAHYPAREKRGDLQQCSPHQNIAVFSCLPGPGIDPMLTPCFKQEGDRTYDPKSLVGFGTRLYWLQSPTPLGATPVVSCCWMQVPVVDTTGCRCLWLARGRISRSRIASEAEKLVARSFTGGEWQLERSVVATYGVCGGVGGARWRTPMTRGAWETRVLRHGRHVRHRILFITLLDTL